MYLYNTQGKLEAFEPEISPQIQREMVKQFEKAPANVQASLKLSMGTDTMGTMQSIQKDIIAERIEQEKTMSLIKQERDWITTIAQERLDFVTEQEIANVNAKPKPVKNLSVEIDCRGLENSKDTAEVTSRCGTCCRNDKDGNKIVDRKAVIDKFKNKCNCFKMMTERELDKDIIFQQSYLENTGTNSGVYKSSITTAEECRDACMRDNTCSYNVFTKQGLCYLANANWRKGVKQERVGNIIDYKILPPSIESVSSAKYVVTDAAAKKFGPKVQTVKPISQANCAQLCANDLTCKYASASSSMECEMTTLPIENATLVSDVNSITYVP